MWAKLACKSKKELRWGLGFGKGASGFQVRVEGLVVMVPPK